MANQDRRATPRASFHFTAEIGSDAKPASDIIESNFRGLPKIAENEAPFPVSVTGLWSPA
ncbi:hypothetical protein [Nannocystis exedens]|uniref:hypothetical protein n=1 Tax=Nannocystis exedens TaxID=54 RepID=UPI001160CB2B|nr:hypothetical protein [Nannocystis exedens]